VFKAVRDAWCKCLWSYYDESRYSSVDKQTFPKLLKWLSDTGAFSRVNAIRGYEACGIYPLNRDKITSDKLSTSIPLTRQTKTGLSTPLEIKPESAHENTGATAQSDVTCSSAEKLTTRKAIETAILSHLKQVTPPDKSDKCVRVSRRLAECLTSHEVRKRMQEDEERKVAGANKKCKTASKNPSKKKTTVVSQPKQQKKTACNRPPLVIRKFPRKDKQAIVLAADARWKQTPVCHLFLTNVLKRANLCYHCQQNFFISHAVFANLLVTLHVTSTLKTYSCICCCEFCHLVL